MQSPPFPRYLVPPRSKYSPQHHVLKHPKLPFLPQCERPSFTPIHNNRQNYNSIYILIFKFLYSNLEDKIYTVLMSDTLVRRQLQMQRVRFMSIVFLPSVKRRSLCICNSWIDFIIALYTALKYLWHYYRWQNSTPAVGFTQTPIQWVLVLLSEGKVTGAWS